MGFKTSTTRWLNVETLYIMVTFYCTSKVQEPLHLRRFEMQWESLSITALYAYHALFIHTTRSEPIFVMQGKQYTSLIQSTNTICFTIEPYLPQRTPPEG